MMRRDAIAIVTVGATLFGAMNATAQVPAAPTPAPAGQTPALPQVTPTAPVPPAAPGVPALPAVPGAAAPAVTPATGGLPVLPGAPIQSTVPGAAPGLPALPGAGTVPGLPAIPGAPAAAAVPTPPPLGDLSPEAADAAETTASISTTAAPSQLYTFLFVDDPDYGVVRHKFESDVAETIKEAEIQRLMQERQNQTGAQGAGLGLDPLNPIGYGAAMDPALMGAYDPTMAGPGLGAGYGAAYGAGYDPTVGGIGTTGLNNSEAIRAAAEWDFYYDQLEMYDRYVREKLVPNAEDLPELAYNASNALQERQDLFESFQEAAVTQNNEDYNDNKQFYERLQKREDRRLAYRQWVLMKQNEVAEWAEVWARNIFGTRWADGEEVRVDDWYYGTDFNSAQPVVVAIDDREYVISRQPVGKLEDEQLNVISTNLTPYDILDANGNLKNPVMETLRGTLVVPPAGPVFSTEAPTTGTIEIVGGSTTE